MLKKRLKQLSAALLIAGCGLIVFFGATANVSAAMSETEIFRKLMINNMFNCYTPTEMSMSVDAMVYNSIGSSGGFTNNVLLNGGTVVYYPTEMNGTNLGISGASCKTLFMGNGSTKGIFTTFGKEVPKTASDLKNLGYTKEETSVASLTCIESNYTSIAERGGGGKVGSVCWENSKIDSGEINDLRSIVDNAIVNNSGDITMQPIYQGNSLSMHYTGRGGTGYSGDFCESIQYSSDLNTNVRAAIRQMGGGCGGPGGDVSNNGTFRISSTVNENVPSSNAGADLSTVSMVKYLDAFSKAANYLSGSGTYPFADGDKLSLYDWYLTNVYHVSRTNECLSRAEVAAAGGVVQQNPEAYYTYNNGKFCKITIPVENYNKAVTVFQDDKYRLTRSCSDVECLLKMIYALDLPDETELPVDSGDSGSASGGTSYDTAVNCDEILDEKNQNLGAMQWLLCPTMDNTTNTANWLDSLTQNLLEVKTGLYTGTDLQNNWGNIRNIANVLIILFLLVVVFSQLTGWGIDNYGIKKMLPRIIVMAIVVNLSFYICQIAVDLSNILGEGLMNLFTLNGADDPPSVAVAILGLFGSGAGTALGTTVTVGMIAGGWVALVVGVILMVIIIIVAIFVLYLMIAARNIIVIFCILISPLAFATFILPNTQNLFKKWWELFKAALIIYPICGAANGVSKSLRTMDFGNVGLAMNLILVVLPFLIFFLLPTLLKQSIAAFGKIGGALTSMGQSIRNTGRQFGQAGMRGVQNSERFKNLQTETARRRQSESSQRTIERLEALKKQREANGEKLSDAETRRLARAHETQRKLGLEDQAARTILTEKDYADKSLDDLLTDWNTAFDSGDTNRMDALTNVIVSRHGPGGVSKIASSLAEREGNKGIFAANGQFRDANMEKSFTALQANMMQNSALSNAMQNKASDVFQMVSGGGYVNGKRQNVSAHAANNGIATQMKDWATQSNATIQRAATNGGFDAKMARDLLNSTDPAIQSGIQSDKDKRATLEAIAGGYEGDWSNEADVDRAKINYAHEQALVENAGFDAYVADRRQAADQAENLRRAAESLENLSRNQGSDNNGGQGFDQGAGI